MTIFNHFLSVLMFMFSCIIMIVIGVNVIEWIF